MNQHANFWTSGYSRAEIEKAQEQYALRFPPDLVDLLLDRRPANAPDWRTDAKEIEEMLAWPVEGILFDVEHNDFWLSDWGWKPKKVADQLDIVRESVRSAPTLIPLYSHRYLPSEPCEKGNPVFSVYQTDIIYYGCDIEDYFNNELGEWQTQPWEAYKPIPFWSDLVKLNSVSGSEG